MSVFWKRRVAGKSKMSPPTSEFAQRASSNHSSAPSLLLYNLERSEKKGIRCQPSSSQLHDYQVPRAPDGALCRALPRLEDKRPFGSIGGDNPFGVKSLAMPSKALREEAEHSKLQRGGCQGDL